MVGAKFGERFGERFGEMWVRGTSRLVNGCPEHSDIARVAKLSVF